MSESIRITCPSCASRLRVEIRVIGTARRCPGCRKKIVVRPTAPEECGPMLVFDDDMPEAARRGVA
jgi:hypothetical protein